MGFAKFIEKTLAGLAGKLLAIDSTKYPEQQFNSVKEILSREQVTITSHDLQDFVRKLKKKHLVDEISVAELNGSLIASSELNGLKQAITSAALYQYINSEINESKAVMIKSKEWVMILPFAGKLYIVKADASLTEIELKALANDIECFLAADSRLEESGKQEEKTPALTNL
ncbi:hypothetical protein HZB89_02510 [archaeon]|nr:hypothetical protein [archaeon]